MLELENIRKHFGGLQALDGVTAAFQKAEFIGLIGPNGSGKTTLLNCISGLYAPESGRIRFGGRIISKLSPPRIFRLGIGRTFQISKVFNRLTVLENLRIPALTEARMIPKEIVKRADAILSELTLEELRERPAEKISGGQKKLLEIGMIMMTDPKVLLLDEPFGGVHPTLKIQLEKYLGRLNEQGKTIILVSHEMASVFRTCSRLLVMDRGRLIADGDPKTVHADERVINAYLGGRHAA